MEERQRDLITFRNSVNEKSDQMAEEMKKTRRKKKGPVSTYKKGEEVLTRMPTKGKRLRRGKKIGEERTKRGKILEVKGDRYYLAFDEGKKEWISVEDLSSLTRQKEKERKGGPRNGGYLFFSTWYFCHSE